MIKVENIGSRIDMQTHTGKAATAAGSTAQDVGCCHKQPCAVTVFVTV